MTCKHTSAREADAGVWPLDVGYPRKAVTVARKNVAMCQEQKCFGSAFALFPGGFGLIHRARVCELCRLDVWVSCAPFDHHRARSATATTYEPLLVILSADEGPVGVLAIAGGGPDQLADSLAL